MVKLRSPRTASIWFILKATPILCAIFVNDAVAKDLVGKPRVVDGDTIAIAGIRIRLHGIDAPETRQTCTDSNNKVYPCGKQSTAYLKSIKENNEVSCEGKDTDRYGRLIAVCYVSGMNLNATMVEEGWAIAYRYYSIKYVEDEVKARKNKLQYRQTS